MADGPEDISKRGDRDGRRAPPGSRDARLKAALQANIARRKAQTRAAAGAGRDPEGPEDRPALAGAGTPHPDGNEVGAPPESRGAGATGREAPQPLAEPDDALPHSSQVPPGAPASGPGPDSKKD